MMEKCLVAILGIFAIISSSHIKIEAAEYFYTRNYPNGDASAFAIVSKIKIDKCIYKYHEKIVSMSANGQLVVKHNKDELDFCEKTGGTGYSDALMEAICGP